MKVTYSKGVCLLSKYASANLYGGTGGSTGTNPPPPPGGQTHTSPNGDVIPRRPSPEPDPDI